MERNWCPAGQPCYSLNIPGWLLQAASESRVGKGTAVNAGYIGEELENKKSDPLKTQFLPFASFFSPFHFSLPHGPVPTLGQSL